MVAMQAYNVCNERDLVPEMVFLLGKMGNNKKALYLIIDRLGDVNRAIDFAKEQHDDDLWEDLLRYSETRPGQYIFPSSSLSSSHTLLTRTRTCTQRSSAGCWRTSGRRSTPSGS